MKPFLIALLLTIAAAPTLAQAPAARPGAQTSRLSASDRNFVSAAARAGMAEVAQGRLAQEKASNTAVRDFGRQMVEDHARTNDRLTSLAQPRGMKLPTAVTSKQRQAEERLRKASGTRFDRAYMKAQVDAHRRTVALFDKQAAQGKDPTFKSFAAESLPRLREHLHLAEDVQKQVAPEPKTRRPNAPARSTG